jgi:hypothetical protein
LLPFGFVSCGDQEEPAAEEPTTEPAEPAPRPRPPPPPGAGPRASTRARGGTRTRACQDFPSIDPF